MAWNAWIIVLGLLHIAVLVFVVVALLRLKTTGQGLVQRGISRVPVVRRFLTMGSQATLPNARHTLNLVQTLKKTALRLVRPFVRRTGRM